MKVLDIPKSGKCGDRVWQSNRYGQYSYPAFVPFNPRSPAQTAVRGAFAAVSARWRTLTQPQRDVWVAVASTMKTKPRLNQCGVMPGYNFFVKTNVALVNQGQAQVDLPAEGSRPNEECIKTAPKAVPGSEHPTSNSQQPITNLEQPAANSQRPPFGSSLDVGCSMLVVGCSQIARRGAPRLRYRSCPGAPPYQHRSSTLAGGWGVHRCSKRRIRFPCRSQPVVGGLPNRC